MRMNRFRRPALAAGLAAATAVAAWSACAAENGPSAPAPAATPVAPLTVEPAATPTPRYVAGDDPASIRSPNFTAKDAEAPPLAIGIAPNTALGRQSSPPSQAGGLQQANPDLKPPATDLGVTVVF